ncbi:MAG: hypothetical protein WCI73_20430 [Phycisphaerae bacterium]
MTLAQLKTSFLQHRGKSLLLGVLVLGFAGMLARNVLLGPPRSASASGLAGPLLPAAGANSAVALQSTQDLAARAALSAKLWETLRTKEGMTPAQAFHFDCAYYTADPSQAAKTDPAPEMPAAAPVVRTTLEDRLRVQITDLHLKSTVMGDFPLAVINNEIFRQGQEIRGFKIATIRPRQITLEKQGQSLVLEIGK